MARRAKADKYDALGYKELKDEAAARKLTVPADVRTVVGLRDLLRKHDLKLAPEEPAEDPGEMTELGSKLAAIVPQPNAAQLRVWGDVGANRNRVEEALRVRNLPAEYVYAWAGLGAGGEDLGRWTSLGWILVTADLVTSDPQNTSKIFVSGYDLHMGSYVRKNDTVLVIAHRKIVKTRETSHQRNWNRKVEAVYGENGELVEGAYAPQEGGSIRFRKTAQRTPEDMLAGGDR